jgi:AcrR family transcriptional regulator
MAGTAEKEKRQYRMKVRARRSEETARRILEMAQERFLTRPFEDVTLTEIARAAGVTVPTLIAHFGRKEELFVTACEDWGLSMIEAREEAPVGDHAGAVRNLFDGYEAKGDLILHLLAEEDRFPAVREITGAGRRYHRLWVEQVFEPSLCSLRGARREQLVVQLIVATDLLTWKQLRLDMKLSRGEAETTVVRMADALTGGG